MWLQKVNLCKKVPEVLIFSIRKPFVPNCRMKDIVLKAGLPSVC